MSLRVSCLPSHSPCVARGANRSRKLTQRCAPGKSCAQRSRSRSASDAPQVPWCPMGHNSPATAPSRPLAPLPLPFGPPRTVPELPSPSPADSGRRLPRPGSRPASKWAAIAGRAPFYASIMSETTAARQKVSPQRPKGAPAKKLGGAVPRWSQRQPAPTIGHHRRVAANPGLCQAHPFIGVPKRVWGAGGRQGPAHGGVARPDRCCRLRVSPEPNARPTHGLCNASTNPSGHPQCTEQADSGGAPTWASLLPLSGL